MSSQLATRQDLLSVRQDLQHLEEKMDLRFQQVGDRIAQVETRLVVKLGTLMAALLGAAATLTVLLR